MELWVRSQDKRILTKIEEVNINYNEENQIIANHKQLSGDEEDYTILGTYKTTERALEVLDEIQNKIEDNEKNYLMACMKEKGTYEVIAWEKFVYEMPKE